MPKALAVDGLALPLVVGVVASAVSGWFAIAVLLRWVARIPAYAVSYASLDEAWALVDRALASNREEETAGATVRPAPATS